MFSRPVILARLIAKIVALCASGCARLRGASGRRQANFRRGKRRFGRNSQLVAEREAPRGRSARIISRSACGLFPKNMRANWLTTASKRLSERPAHPRTLTARAGGRAVGRRLCRAFRASRRSFTDGVSDVVAHADGRAASCRRRGKGGRNRPRDRLRIRSGFQEEGRRIASHMAGDRIAAHRSRRLRRFRGNTMIFSGRIYPSERPEQRKLSVRPG